MNENVSNIAESVVEQAVLDWLKGLGWCIAYESEIAPDIIGHKCHDYG